MQSIAIAAPPASAAARAAASAALSGVKAKNPPMLKRAVPGVRGWTGRTIRRADWVLPIPRPAMAELEAMVATLRRAPMEALMIGPENFRIPALRALMRRVKRMLDAGSGLAVLDRLPAERFSKAEMTTIYWVLSKLIARPVPQYFRGTLLHDVTDTGARMGLKVRGDLTNQEINWHTDNGFNPAPPYFGLAVLRTAKAGGESRAANLLAAHNRLRTEAPELLARLYRPFHWNRLGEHNPDEAPTNRYPVYQWTGARLVCRYNRRLIQAGHEIADHPLDDIGARAIDRLYEILDEPGFALGYTLVPGQLQWMDNWSLVHHRTAFTDWDEPEKKRHLVRIYLRDWGRPSYLG
ncbi:MAG: TauD/TfdA family dioxygenase [Alphaproteobacteria bacterium]|nr:TauD/TfdA family dioxygenase [Alphaproteobacteria bacterium]